MDRSVAAQLLHHNPDRERPHNFVNRPGQRLVDSLELLVANR